MLWHTSPKHQIDGHGFRRQMPIGPYFADFICLARRIVVDPRTLPPLLHEVGKVSRRRRMVWKAGRLDRKFAVTFVQAVWRRAVWL